MNRGQKKCCKAGDLLKVKHGEKVQEFHEDILDDTVVELLVLGEVSSYVRCKGQTFQIPTSCLVTLADEPILKGNRSEVSDERIEGSGA